MSTNLTQLIERIVDRKIRLIEASVPSDLDGMKRYLKGSRMAIHDYTRNGVTAFKIVHPATVENYYGIIVFPKEQMYTYVSKRPDVKAVVQKYFSDFTEGKPPGW